jgi:hypothetical protein
VRCSARCSPHAQREDTYALAHNPVTATGKRRELPPRLRTARDKLLRMYVSALVAHGFRNLEGRIPLCEPLVVVIGENNAGKSNVIDGLRLLFKPEAGRRARQWIGEEDFRHDGTGLRMTEEFELEAELRGLTEEDQVRMVTCLAPSLGVDAARLRLRARLLPAGGVDVECLDRIYAPHRCFATTFCAGGQPRSPST